ncbi:helix-turn-helix transcriptional regulator [Streptomonospora arabica]|uniref:Helix-turn-helix domain-containing protein n=1 Tax=Streptomonospora arabica TaxID=412417 RepID=A0ABV9SLZ9_9ACTN
MELGHACREAGIGVVAAGEHTGPPRLHRALPALSTRLVLSLGAPVEIRYDGHTSSMQAVVAGLMRPGKATPSLVLRPHQPTVYVELSPLAMHRLTGVPLGEVDAGGVGADTLLPWLRRLSEELAGRTAGQRERLMRVRLLERLERTDRRAVSRDALEPLKIIGAGAGRVPVDDLARRAHLSPRHLRHVMRTALGIGPKLASRVARLSAAVDRAADGAGSWAQVAAESGYHDQSHLVRDFRDLMHTTPSAWLAEEGRNLQGWRRPSP